MKKAMVTRIAATNMGSAAVVSAEREEKFELSRNPARMGPKTSVRLLVD